MTFPGAQDNVSDLCHLHHGAQRILTIVEQQVGLCAVEIGEDLPVDRGGVLRIRVVRGDDGVVGVFPGGLSQFPTAVFRPTAHGAEKTDQPMRMVFPQYPQRAFETEPIVRVIE